MTHSFVCSQTSFLHNCSNYNMALHAVDVITVLMQGKSHTRAPVRMSINVTPRPFSTKCGGIPRFRLKVYCFQMEISKTQEGSQLDWRHDCSVSADGSTLSGEKLWAGLYLQPSVVIPTLFVGGGGRLLAAREASEVTSTELLPPLSLPPSSSSQPLLPSARLLLCFSQGQFVSRSVGTRLGVGVATRSRPALTCLLNSDNSFFS